MKFFTATKPVFAVLLPKMRCSSHYSAFANTLLYQSKGFKLNLLHRKGAKSHSASVENLQHKTGSPDEKVESAPSQ